MAAKGQAKTGGRKTGTPNRITAEVKTLPQKHAPDAIEELARLSTAAESEAARVAAIKELLDRAYGKSPQAVVGGPSQPINHNVRVGIGWMTKEQAKARGWA